MIFKIRYVSDENSSEEILINLPKEALIKQVQILISNNLNISVHRQLLLYGGKQLEFQFSIGDYKIQHNDIVQLLAKPERYIDSPTPFLGFPRKKQKTDIIPGKSLYYNVGDYIDVCNEEFGMWSEAKIIAILKHKDDENIERNLIFKTHMDWNDKNYMSNIGYKSIRPRAQYTYKKEELARGMIVLVNYNFEDPKVRGYWYDFQIEDIQKNRISGTILEGLEHERNENCVVKYTREVMKIEYPTLLSERKIIIKPISRKMPLYCNVCDDDESEKCRNCGCYICGGKDDESELILCDECDDAYHIYCLRPKLSSVPEEEWYCPLCINDQNEIIKPYSGLASMNLPVIQKMGNEKVQMNLPSTSKCIEFEHINEQKRGGEELQINLPSTSNCIDLQEIDVQKLDTQELRIDLPSTSNCNELEQINLQKLDTEQFQLNLLSTSNCIEFEDINENLSWDANKNESMLFRGYSKLLDDVLISEQETTPNKKQKLNDTESDRVGEQFIQCEEEEQVLEIPINHYGSIPGIKVGTCWKFRKQVSQCGIHRPPMSGIHGKTEEGAYSIILSGSYEDDEDNGNEFFYTGSGGRINSQQQNSKQTEDQTLTRVNKALALNCNAKFNLKGAKAKNWKGGKPVRVIRNYKAKNYSKFAPKDGNRYDGIYKVVKYFPESGKSGFIVWKYLLRRDDSEPAPWEDGGQEFEMILPEVVEFKPHHQLVANSRLRPRQPKMLTNRNQEVKIVARRKNLKKKFAKPKNKSGTKKTFKMKFFGARPTKKKAEKQFKLTMETQRRIKNDYLNERNWNECLEEVHNGKEAFLYKVKELFTCICCLELVQEPVTIECKHSLCKNCLIRSFKYGLYYCPYCRKQLKYKYKIKVNTKLKSLLTQFFPNYISTN